MTAAKYSVRPVAVHLQQQEVKQQYEHENVYGTQFQP